MSSVLLTKVSNPVTLRVNTMYKEECASCTPFSVWNFYLVTGIYEIPVIKIYNNLRGYEKHPIGRNESRKVETILLILQGVVVVPLGLTPSSLHFTVTVYLCAPYDSHSTEPLFPFAAFTDCAFCWQHAVYFEVRTELCMCNVEKFCHSKVEYGFINGRNAAYRGFTKFQT
jgi:hypothetical protein